MRSRITFFLLLLLTAMFFRMQAQIYSPSANDSLTAFYGNDKVFIFNKPFYKAPLTASIIALPVDRSEGWTFQWYIYSKFDSAYQAIPGASSGSFSFVDTVTVTSGYQVEMTRGVERETFRTWIIMNDLDVRILNKDQNDTLLFGYYDCTSLDLHGDTTKPATYYINPATHQKYDPGHNYIIRWTTDNEEAVIPASRLLTRVSDPPWMDTWYKLTVRDRFGMSRTDSVIYKSIQSKAFVSSLEYIQLSDTSVYPPREPWFEEFYTYEDNSVSAPAIFRFDISGSRNFDGFELNFGDGDSLIGGNDTVVVYHEFKQPGNYKILLTTWSEPPFVCVDTVSPDPVVVHAASEENFNMPNVFTPGKDENGSFMPVSIFRTTDVSVIYIDITIFTRTGQKVHEFEGNIRDWPGWDGTIRNSGREAPEGIYYYVISTFNAYQDKNNPINRKLMNGFIHLYRH